MKKKGSALLTTIIVVLMLTILATTVLSVSVSSYVSTTYIEKTDQLRLAVESGVEKEIAKLKTNPLQGDENYTFTQNGMDCTVKYKKTAAYDGTNPDLAGKTMGLIETTASKNGRTKSSKVFFQLTTTSGLEQYYQRMTNYSLVVNDDLNASNLSVDSSNAGLVPLTTTGTTTGGGASGSVFLQGGTVNLQPGFFNIQGNLVVNAKSFNLSSNNDALFGEFEDPEYLINWHYEEKNIGSAGKSTIQGGNLYLKADSYTIDNNSYVSNSDTGDHPDILKKHIMANTDGTVIPILSTSSETDSLPRKPDSSTPTFYVYKPTKVAGETFDFNTLAFKFKSTIGVNEEAYKSYYKVLIVDGDLNIENPYPCEYPEGSSNYSYFTAINYIIYCTGKVTFRGEVKFTNSSIFAKQIKFDRESYGYKGAPTYLQWNWGWPPFIYVYDHYYTNVIISGTDKALWEPYHDKIINYLKNALTGYTDTVTLDVKEWTET